MKTLSLVLPSMALAAATLMLLPASESQAFSLTGSSLGLNQRDFRLRNNFSDSATNNNTTPSPMFPGALGVFLATWKGAAEWGSVPHGDGSGDPTQGILGSGGANFDAFWSGISSGVGTTNTNVVSATTGCGNGVIAFAELPTSDGWRIRFCDDQFTFADGPGSVGGQIDFQSIMCHEYGHVLGLGHSSDGGATMFASYSGGTGSRSINADDSAGVQAIYGAASSNKPLICGTSASGSTLTILGSGFDATDNEVWFNRTGNTVPSMYPIVVVSGVASTLGGSRIDVAIPSNAKAGDIAVKLPGTSSTHRLMSNCYPSDLLGSFGTACTFQVSNVSPSSIPALDPGTAQSVTVQGAALDTVTSITLEPSMLIPSSSWTLVDSGTITIDMPTAASLGVNTLTLDTGSDSDSVNLTVVAGQVPILQIGSGDPLNQVADGETFTATLSGTPGHQHRIYFSTSNVPSNFPKANFLIGNNFTQLSKGPTVTIGGNGIGSLSMPLSYPGASNTTFYVQSLGLTAGSNPEFQISNLQSVVFTP